MWSKVVLSASHTLAAVEPYGPSFMTQVAHNTFGATPGPIQRLGIVLPQFGSFLGGRAPNSDRPSHASQRYVSSLPWACRDWVICAPAAAHRLLVLRLPVPGVLTTRYIWSNFRTTPTVVRHPPYELGLARASFGSRPAGSRWRGLRPWIAATRN